MDDQPSKWKKFQKTAFDKKAVGKRARKVEGATLRHARKFLFQRLENIRDVRRHIIGWLVLITLLIAGAGLQMVWFQQMYVTSAPAPGGTYAEAVLGRVETLNPLFAASSAEQSVREIMFSSLYDYDTTGHLKGDLAQTMSVNDKGTEYTVTIPPDVRWHDGARLTAYDIEFTLKLLKDPATRSTITGYQNVDAKVINETTIQFLLPNTYASFPHALTFPILPKHVLGDVSPGALRQNAFSRNPLGSGPFTFRLEQSLSSDDGREVIYFVANDAYYKGAPKLSRFQLHVYGDRDSIVRALQTNEVNAATDITATDMKKLDPNRFILTSTPTNGGVFAFFNTTSPLLTDVNVRRALRLGTDTGAIRDSLDDKQAKPLALPFVPGQLTDDGLPAVPANQPEQAAALLDQAGWVLVNGVRTKDGQPLKLRVTTIKGGEQEKALDTLAEQWRKLGVVVVTLSVDPSDPSQNVVQGVLQPRDYDVLVYELVIGADPDVFAYWHSSQTNQRGFNFSNYSNPISDDALSSARSRLEPQLRDAKYKSFVREWVNDVPAIGLYQTTLQYARTPRTVAFDTQTTLVSNDDRYNNLLYWTVEEQSVYKTP